MILCHSFREHALFLDKFYDYMINCCYDQLCVESSSTAFIIAGDFNPTSNGFLQKYVSRRQVVKQLTRGRNTLDLIFTNIAEFYECPETKVPLSTSDHNVITWISKCSVAEKKENKIKTKVRPITTQQVDVFNTVLYNFDWSTVFSTKDINEKVDVFLRITDGLINEFFPE